MRRLAAPLSLLVLASGLVLWLAVVPIVSAGDPCYHDYAMPSQTTASTAQVRLQPCAFSPTVTQVEVGETVTFTNGTDFTHLVTGANQAWGSRDVELLPGETADYRFDTAGTYPYACALHRGMSGVILVGDAQAAAAAPVAGSGTTGSAPTANATEPAGPPDGRIILVSVLAGALLGGLVAWIVARRGPARGTTSADGVARGV